MGWILPIIRVLKLRELFYFFINIIMWFFSLIQRWASIRVSNCTTPALPLYCTTLVLFYTILTFFNTSLTLFYHYSKTLPFASQNKVSWFCLFKTIQYCIYYYSLVRFGLGRFGLGRFGLGRFGQLFFEDRTFWPNIKYIKREQI